MKTRSSPASQMQAEEINGQANAFDSEVGPALDLGLDRVKDQLLILPQTVKSARAEKGLTPSKRIKYAFSSDEQDSDYLLESDYSEPERDCDKDSILEDAAEQNMSEHQTVPPDKKKKNCSVETQQDVVDQAQDTLPTPPTTVKKPRKAKAPKIDFNTIHPELQHVWKDLSEQTQPKVTLVQPDGLSCTLLPFQLKGVQFMKGQEDSTYKGGILADEMV
jgi:SNF2 family DNA or RNA helicase